MNEYWNLGFPQCLLDDGTYPVVSQGQTVRSFALEFWPGTRLRRSEEKTIHAKWLSGCTYRVCARVIYRGPKGSVIDFGIRAAVSGDILEQDIGIRDFVAGDIYIGFAPSIPAEVPDDLMPSLAHTWKVETILADRTPYLETRDSANRRTLIRDRSRELFQQVEATSPGHTDYVLRCINLAADRDLP